VSKTAMWHTVAFDLEHGAASVGDNAQTAFARRSLSDALNIDAEGYARSHTEQPRRRSLARWLRGRASSGAHVLKVATYRPVHRSLGDC